ncbi:MAG: hypothetical protein JWL77_6734 [Chthonomonadaceae bacterium]|nr:hypothetical protein [Chthonomonadaceae bacterium]
MAEKTAVQKMMIRAGDTVAFVNAPEGYPGALGALPDPLTILYEPSLSADVTQVFVNSRSDLNKQLAYLKPFVSPSAALWVAFRKGTSKPKPDFNRDDVLAEARSAGFQNLTLISLDIDWSAFKVKVAEAP